MKEGDPVVLVDLPVFGRPSTCGASSVQGPLGVRESVSDGFPTACRRRNQAINRLKCSLDAKSETFHLQLGDSKQIIWICSHKAGTASQVETVHQDPRQPFICPVRQFANW